MTEISTSATEESVDRKISAMALVNFEEFRLVTRARVTVNNAMVALLAGSRLASHTLQLTAGSEQLLPRIFPSVANIDRFNIVTENAKSRLDQADMHVVTVSVPYALSVHEDFVLEIVEMVRARGVAVEPPSGSRLGPATMHEALFSAIGHTAPPETLEVFHILREMRNSQIHAGGRASARLTARIEDSGPAAAQLWRSLAKQEPADALQDGRVAFALDHMFVVFAIIKRLGREVNLALQTHWSPDEWARLLVRDFQASTTRTKNSSAWRRGLIGFARVDYAALRLSEDVIERAARASNAWTAKAWS